MIYEEEKSYTKVAFCIALYILLLIIWLPGFNMSSNIHIVSNQDKVVQRRKVLRPPPQKPLEKVKVQDKKLKKVPIPDLTPDMPEPIIEKDPLKEPDIIDTDDWEIGIPDESPPMNDIVTVGEKGVESPIFIKRTQPIYPKIAIKVRMSGTVILQAVLRKDGTVSDIKVIRDFSKGKFGFADNAIEALKSWEFLPGKIYGKETDVRMTLTLSYRIQ